MGRSVRVQLDITQFKWLIQHALLKKTRRQYGFPAKLTKY